MSSPPKAAPARVEYTDADRRARTTARECRERESAVVSRQLARTLADHDLSHSDLAAQIGRSRSKVQQLTDPEQPDAYTVADLRLSPPDVAAELARCGLEPHGYDVRKVHAHDSIADDLAHLAEVNIDTAELQAHMLRALADGSITAVEAAEGIRCCDDVIERLEALKARLGDALRARVSPIRRGGSGPS